VGVGPRDRLRKVDMAESKDQKSREAARGEGAPQAERLERGEGPPREDFENGANGHIQPGRYYGHGLPYLPTEHYPGKIIAIEGTDGVGRSTQIRLLREWLEVQGYGVAETGWTRSALMQPTIELAKASNTLNKLTFVLLYATDFADRLEKEIIPALKGGFVVLSDRYIFSALARAGVRGVDRAWLRSLYGFAIAPHLVFYLKTDVDTLIRRVLAARGMDFWESGMDLKGADDIYDSFRSYQGKLLREYTSMADEFGFRVLDARQSIDAIQDDLRRQVQAFLSSSDIAVEGPEVEAAR
jgi:dTMP kinase